MIHFRSILIFFLLCTFIIQGVVNASFLGGVGVWSPPLERSTLLAIGFSGASLGPAIGYPLAGVIADNLGWEAVFYITGK